MNKQEIQKYWNNRSKSYDLSPGHTDFPEIWKDLLSKIFKGRCKILDVGTGTGFIAILLAELGHEVVGIDISKGMLKKAKKKSRHLKIDFKLGDAENLPFINESFDAIVCRHVFWTLPNPEKAAKEWFRVIKPGGKVAIIDGVYYNSGLSSKVKSIVGKLGIAIIERRNLWRMKYPSKVPKLDLNKYSETLNQAGFNKLKIHDISWIRKLMLENRPFLYKLAWNSKTYFILEAFKEV